MLRRNVLALSILWLSAWTATANGQAGSGAPGAAGRAGTGAGGGGSRGAGAAAAPAAKGVDLPEVPVSLDEMLAVALRSNPTILQAEAKLRNAQTNLNQARLKVMQEVISGFHEKQKQIAAVELFEQKIGIAKQLVATGQASQDAIFEPLRSLADSRAAIAQTEALMRYTLGLGGSLPGMTASDAPARAASSDRQRGSFRADVLELLGQKLTVSFVSAPLEDVLSHLKELSGGKFQTMIDTLDTSDAPRSLASLRVTFELSDVSLRAVLGALSDVLGICFVFRDYGVLVTIPERAATKLSPVIPEETPLRPQ